MSATIRNLRALPDASLRRARRLSRSFTVTVPALLARFLASATLLVLPPIRAWAVTVTRAGRETLTRTRTTPVRAARLRAWRDSPDSESLIRARGRALPAVGFLDSIRD